MKESYEQIQTVISERTYKQNFLVSEKKNNPGTLDVTPPQWLKFTIV